MVKFYITSAIPYVNAKPHIGHALEFIQADTISRFHKLQGDETLYLCGSDENALKNVQAAEKSGLSLQVFIDQHAKEFENLADKLNVHFDIFQKGSSTNHYQASQKLWDLCLRNGDIYKKSYQGLYCIGCEEFKTKNDLTKKGECPEHFGKTLEEVEEENYFFRLSRYQKPLLELFNTNQYEIVPEFRKNEILSFIKSGLQDFSISRSNKRAKNWGVPVPDDPTQIMYVWFDALNIYQSGIGFSTDEAKYQKWWPADLHVVGKGIIRFHAIYWPAILLSAGLKLPKKLFVHEYFTVNGQKMSKTIGNVYDPLPLIEKYGEDSLRYYCLAKISPFQDGDFSEEKFIESYNADLANGLGNLVARVAKLAESNSISLAPLPSYPLLPQVEQKLKEMKFNEALSILWKRITTLNQKISEEKPWELKTQEARKKLHPIIDELILISYNLKPFLPKTSSQILSQFSNKIQSKSPLFPRIT